ncbi:MAG: Ppx/GppA family phosphatase [Synergistaceae bacterium]|nr:Ppx/GppA family phosphatase [Synergistaceae bacterium]
MTRKKNGRALTKAVIDIGSNSVKLRIVSKKGNRLYTVLDTTEVVRLGKGLGSGALDDKIMRRGAEVIWRLTRLAGEKGAIPRLVGTMALRMAGNADEFTRMVLERTGISVEILSGKEEARLAWLGATMALGATGGDITVFDTGGGSTEFAFGKGTQIEESFSVPVGAVCMTEKFFSADSACPESLRSAKEYVRDILTSAGELGRVREKASCVIGLGGGVAAMASVKLALTVFLPEVINGTFLTKSDIDAQVSLYASSSLAERKKITGLPPKRADIILASACIVQCIQEVLEIDVFKVSINGLRHGLLLEMFKDRAME